MSWVWQPPAPVWWAASSLRRRLPRRWCQIRGTRQRRRWNASRKAGRFSRSQHRPWPSAGSAAVLVTKGGVLSLPRLVGNAGNHDRVPVVRVAGRSAGHAWAGSDIFGKWAVKGAAGSACSCCSRRRGDDLRRRLNPHRRSSTLRVSSSQRGSGIGRRRPTFRLFHRGDVGVSAGEGLHGADAARRLQANPISFEVHRVSEALALAFA